MCFTVCLLKKSFFIENASFKTQTLTISLVMYIIGTDTMAYSASALSFMLMHLGKTVILTGSVIPLSQEPNDATDNVGKALFSILRTTNK